MKTFRKRNWAYWGAIGVVLYLMVNLASPILNGVNDHSTSEILTALPLMPWYAQFLLTLKITAIVIYLLILSGLALRLVVTKHFGIALFWVAVAEFFVRFQMIGDATTGREYTVFAGQLFGKALEVGVVAALVFYGCNKRDDDWSLGAEA